MGDDTQLGHASSLQSGQRIADGKHYHGSPAQETAADYCPIEPEMDCTATAAGDLCALAARRSCSRLLPLPIVILNYWYPYFAQYRRRQPQLTDAAIVADCR